MARTKRGGKEPGWEFWSRRPLSYYTPNKQHKKMCHQIERAHEKELIREELRELNPTAEKSNPPSHRRYQNEEMERENGI